MPRCICLLGLLCVTGCTSYTGDMRLVQGIWRIRESHGEEQNQSKAAFDTQLTIDGHLIATDDEKAVWRFELNENAAPKEIDLEVLAGPDKGQRHRGIYALRGDRWVLMIQKTADRPRPSEFELGEKGSGLFLIELARVR